MLTLFPLAVQAIQEEVHDEMGREDEGFYMTTFGDVVIVSPQTAEINDRMCLSEQEGQEEEER